MCDITDVVISSIYESLRVRDKKSVYITKKDHTVLISYNIVPIFACWIVDTQITFGSMLGVRVRDLQLKSSSRNPKKSKRQEIRKLAISGFLQSTTRGGSWVKQFDNMFQFDIAEPNFLTRLEYLINKSITIAVRLIRRRDFLIFSIVPESTNFPNVLELAAQEYKKKHKAELTNSGGCVT